MSTRSEYCCTDCILLDPVFLFYSPPFYTKSRSITHQSFFIQCVLANDNQSNKQATPPTVQRASPTNAVTWANENIYPYLSLTLFNVTLLSSLGERWTYVLIVFTTLPLLLYLLSTSLMWTLALYLADEG